MVGSSSARVQGVDRFYNPPALRKQLQLQQQQNQPPPQRPVKSKSRPPPPQAAPSPSPSPAPSPSPPPASPREPENRAESDDSSSKASVSTSSSCPLPAAPVANLDRFLQSTTPVVPAKYTPKKSSRGLRNWEGGGSSPHFSLGDLWESFGEWSAYGAGVPLVLEGGDEVVQYYVPYLSAIQLFVDSSRTGLRSRQPDDERNGEAFHDANSDTSTDGDADRHLRERIQSLRITSPAGQGVDIKACSGSQLPVFEYLEREQPYGREPLASKMSDLASKFPDLKTYKSCDLLPCSWMSVAWYPIYRIPTGPTLRDLDACFLTFHLLSTKSENLSNGHSEMNGFYGTRNPNGPVDRISKLSLPVFGLASYKFRGSIWMSNGVYEQQKTSSLFQAADNWLRSRQVDHPDFRFFRTHSRR